jgi:hypothetical protein
MLWAGECQHTQSYNIGGIRIPVTKAERLKNDKRRSNRMAGSSGNLGGQGNHYGPSYILLWAANPTEDPNTQFKHA